MECIPTLNKGDWGTCEDGHPQRCECCAGMTQVFQKWLSPNERCSIMRSLLRPLFNSELYQKYKNCKFKGIAVLIGLIGAIIYGYSFYTFSWKCELEECLCGSCSEGYKSLLLYLFVRGIVINANGLIFSLGLLYGVLAEKPDYIYLWLLWKSIVIILGGLTLGLMAVMSYAIEENMRQALLLESGYLLTNLITWVIVYAYYEQVCSCLEEPGDEEGGGDEDGEAEGGAGMTNEAVDDDGEFLPQDYMIPPGNAGQNANSQGMMGGVMSGPNQAQNMTMYAVPGSQLPPHLVQEALSQSRSSSNSTSSATTASQRTQTVNAERHSTQKMDEWRIQPNMAVR